MKKKFTKTAIRCIMTTGLKTQTHYLVLISLINKFYENQEEFIDFVNQIAEIGDNG